MMCVNFSSRPNLQNYQSEEMPELPEVEGNRLALHRTVLNKKIINVNVYEQGNGPRHGLFDDLVLQSNESEIKSKLMNSVIKSTGRKGKQMYAVLSNKTALLFHFGMTGSIVFQNMIFPAYKNFTIDNSTWPPRFTKLELTFEGGENMAFCDPRRLGRVRVMPQESMFTSPPLSDLAVDPMDPIIDRSRIYSAFQKSSANIKALLLQQDRIFCGIGNWIADEVLYQAKIDPSSKSSSLSLDQLEDLVDKVVHVNKEAVRCIHDGEDYPAHWLFHYRWGKGRKATSSMPDGSPIRFKTIGGRTTAIVTGNSVDDDGDEGKKPSRKKKKT